VSSKPFSYLFPFTLPSSYRFYEIEVKSSKLPILVVETYYNVFPANELPCTVIQAFSSAELYSSESTIFLSQFQQQPFSVKSLLAFFIVIFSFFEVPLSLIFRGFLWFDLYC